MDQILPSKPTLSLSHMFAEKQMMMKVSLENI